MHPPADVRLGAPRPSSPPQATDGEEKKSSNGQAWVSRITEGGGRLPEGGEEGRDDLGSAGAGVEDTGSGARRGRARKKPVTIEDMIQ